MHRFTSSRVEIATGMFMVLITIVTGAYKPTYNWGGLTLYIITYYYIPYDWGNNHPLTSNNLGP